MNKNKLFLMFILLVGSLMFVSAAYTLSNPQLTHGGTFSSFEKDVSDTSFDSSMCQEGQDFIVQIAPFGCESAVVRSDLLEEQDVPVFCQLQAVKINPFIDVTFIDSINIRGEYPREVKSVGFTPSYSALGENRDLNNLQWDEIGYATIILRRNPNESSMSDFVTGNLSATIKYDLKNAFGLQKHTFYLPTIEDSEFDKSIGQYAFFNRMGYLRAEDVTKDSASIAIYSGRYEAPFGKSREGEVDRQRFFSERLAIGQTTGKIYLSGFDCFSAVQFRLEDIEFQDTRVRFNINSQIFEVKEEESFLDNKCRVTDIESAGLNQIVKVYCQEDEGGEIFDLRISPKIKLEINGVEDEYDLGDYLFETGGGKFAYLGYIGSQTYEVKDLVAYVVVGDKKMAKLKDSEILAAGKLGELNPTPENLKENLQYVQGHSSNFYNWLFRGNSFVRLNYSSNSVDIGSKKVKITGFGSENDYPITSEIENYYNKALDDYDYIFSNYQGEIYPEEEINLGEKSVYAKMLLARDTSQKKDLKFFCDEFESNFPDSELDTGFCKNLILLSNQGISTKEMIIDGEVKQLSFEGVYQPSIEDYGVVLYVKKKGGEIESHELRKEQVLYLDSEGKEYIQLISIKDEDNAVFKVHIQDKKNLGQIQDVLISENRNFKKDVSEPFVNYTFTVHDIYFERVAKISVEPSINYAGSEIDFNFAVGIEKRGIQLSPEMTQDVIDKINDTLETWESISSTLGDTIDVLQTTCLAVGGVLTLKNLLFNSGGESIARQDVMNGAGGWYEKCAEMIAAGDYKTEEECIQENTDNIDNEVELLAEMLNNQNEEIKTIQEDEEVSQSQGLFGTTVVNTTKLVEEYLPKVMVVLKKRGDFIVNPDKTSETISVSSLEKILTIDGWDNNLFSFDLLKEIKLYADVLNEGGLTSSQKESYESKLFFAVKQLDVNSENYVRINNWADSLGTTSNNIDFVKIGSNVQELPYDNLIFEDLEFSESKEYNLSKLSSHVYVLNSLSKLSGTYSSIAVGSFIESLHNSEFLTDTEYADMKGETGISHDVSELNLMLPIVKNTPVKLLQGSDGRKYILILENSGIDQLNIKVDENYRLYIYGGNGKRLSTNEIPTEIRNIYCKIYDSSSYKNSYKNPKVTYYETDPYKGVPSVVPFDINDGWYAYVEQSIDFVGEIRSYDKSARVNSFWLCNVGSNGLEEFSKGNTGDDICQLINLGTGQAYNQFSGLKSNEAAKKIDEAVNAIEYASKAYEDGVKTVKIGNQKIEVGNPAVSSSLTKCEDYMSPKDCKVLFNVCDPVICPSSRCDFGGQYPVQDVIQSGIIGSLLLCLPNYNEGIYMPVCLTGVKAGIDNYLSILGGYQSCLQESLDTGSTIGVCDQINSVYLCEFFWRQALPLAELTLPKIIGAVTGENTRGGGEYSRLDTAWDNAKNSVNFFTEFYAINSFNSFKARSQDEIGSEVCKSFISVSYPEGQGILDSLTITDSPPQYSGNFEAILFTSATVPPISQYSVSYRIYAGKNQGAYYKVYLRGGSGSSYYQDTFSGRMVDSGFIPVGESVIEKKDFTAPEGYQELCIAVNNEEECGFKQVSTSFAFDYVRDQSRQSQIEATDIKSQDECVSGSANIYGLLNLNVQEGIENTINPEIYNQGITRICATSNPGLGSDPYLGDEGQRWIDVGYCGDTGIRCWIDQESIDNALEFQTSVNESLKALGERAKENIENENGYLNPEQFAEKIENISNEKDRNKRFEMVQELFGKVYLNNHKAYLYYLRAGIYEEIVKELFSELDLEDENYYEEVPVYGEKKNTVLDIVTADGFESGEFEFEDEEGIMAVEEKICYKFFEEKWHWNKGCNEAESWGGLARSTWQETDADSVDKLNDLSKAFIGELKKNNNYLGGINTFIVQTKSGIFDLDNPILTSRNFENSILFFRNRGMVMNKERVFIMYHIPNDVGDINFDVYFVYKNGKWYWSFFDEKFPNKVWLNVTTIKEKEWKNIVDKVGNVLEKIYQGVSLGNYEAKTLSRKAVALPEDYQKVILSLQNKSLEEGAAILFGDVNIEDLKSELFHLGWSYVSALERAAELEGNYNSNIHVYALVEELYAQDFLTEEEYNEMRGVDKDGNSLEMDAPDVSYLNVIFADYLNLVGEDFGVGGDFGVTGGEGVCEVPEEPSEEILALGSASERVLKKVDELVGKPAYIGSSGCYSAIQYVYEQAGVTHSCVYSDSGGREYLISDNKVEMKAASIEDGCKGITHCVNNIPTKSCNLNKASGENLDLSDKLNGIQPGDILSYVYNKDNGHNVIFIKWVDSRISKAEVFDWNGPRVNGKKTYRFTEVILQDDEHPVYMYWEPIIVGEDTSTKEKVPVDTLEIEEKVEIQDTTSPKTIIPLEIQTVQYTLESAIEKAGSLKGDYSTSQENKDFMDALLYQGIINRVEFYIISDKWDVYSRTPQMSDLRELLLKIKANSPRKNSYRDISNDHFSSAERKVFLNGENCNECGPGLSNCDEEECFVLGITLEKNCVFDPQFFGDDCTEKGESKVVSSSDKIESISEVEEVCDEGDVECEEKVQEVQEEISGEEYNVIDRGEWIDIQGNVLVKEEYEILENVVERTAFINHVGDLYSSGRVKVSQEHVVEIDFSGFGLTDISFLENFPELRSLNLNNNNVKDISVLSELNKLNKLEMQGNYVFDLSPLKDLNSLNYLDMELNDIIDVSPLMSLDNLQEVYLKSNKILDIIYLEKNSVVRLDVRDNCLFSGGDYNYFKELGNTFLIDNPMRSSCANEQYVRNFIYASLQGFTGLYSLKENKKFVDALYSDGFLTETEYEEIIGGSWWQFGKSEKDMEYVTELFYNKFIK